MTRHSPLRRGENAQVANFELMTSSLWRDTDNPADRASEPEADGVHRPATVGTPTGRPVALASAAPEYWPHQHFGHLPRGTMRG